MIYTLFLSPLHQAWSDDVLDPSDSKVALRFDDTNRFNILYKKVEQFELDDGDTRAISFANYASTDWVFLIYRVIGEATVNTSGVDTDGSTPISAKLPAYGNHIFPGIGLLSTYNVSTFTIESHQDSTKIELFAAISCADNDPLLDENA